MDTSETTELLNYGDHACLIYNDINEYKEGAIKYIIDGLKKNEKVVCVIDEYPIELFIEDCKNSNLNIDDYLESGQMIITSMKNVYSNNDTFNPENTIDYYIESAKRSQKEKFTGFRVLGEINFILDSDLDTIEKFIEYEYKCNHQLLPFFKNHLYLCACNRKKSSSWILEEIIRVHPIVIDGTTVVKPNPYYSISENSLEQFKCKWKRSWLSLAL